VKRLAARKDWEHLVTSGPPLARYPGHPVVGLVNANPFGYGIANLGGNTIAQYLLRHEVNVHFAFADTVANGRFFVDADLAPASCDVLAVSVPFEDTYLNVLRLLDRAGIPLLAADREDAAPLVVGGGMAMINPLPLQDCFDVVVVGEGREALLELTRRWIAEREAGSSRQAALEAMVDIPGVYVPSHYSVELDAEGYVTEFECQNGRETVVANVPLDMNEHPMYSVWTSRYACYEQEDYFSVMAAMGCHKKCPFCVVGHVQGAASGRALTMDEDVIVDLAVRRRETYGTRLVKIFFSSAFSPDEGDINSRAIKELLRRFISLGFECRVGSLNVRQADDELFELLSRVGQREVTFAPETVEELRPRLGKSYIKDSKLVELAALAGRHGFSLNIYSLGGLPGETIETTREFARLLRTLRAAQGRGGSMFVHYNPAFMKAQTPYAFLGNTRPDEIRRRYHLLREQVADLDVEFVSVVDDSMVYYQPVLALGDANSARVLRHLYRRPTVTEQDWQRAFVELGLSDERYFTAKDPERRLPWEHIAYTDQERLRRRAGPLVELQLA
jgi:radical SAM superfamily enzyme YgiQ (UPF0313 family)